MTNSKTKPINSVLIYFSILCIATACSTASVQQSERFNANEVNSILFKFKQDKNFYGISLPKKQIINQVVGNLTQWGYKITRESAHPSHIMSVKIGSAKQGATPVGFSFSSGNSDPRALNFQKAKVFSLTCTLSPENDPNNSAELSMDIMNTDYAAMKGQSEKLTAMLIDDLSTVCFNLLSQLEIKPEATESATKIQSKPSWIPAIRVEVINETETNISNIKSTAKQTDKVSTQPDKTPRKRIIINNQGSPVIFKFGYERR